MLRPGLIGLAVLVMVLTVLAPARQRAAAAVRLDYFKAEWKDEYDKVMFSWRTATELNTAGFIVQRSTSPGGPYVEITEMIRARGDQLAGGEYGVPPFDEVNNPRIVDDSGDLILGATYWYRLVEIDTDNSRHDDIGPVVAVLAGTEATVTPTPTRTRTPTVTTAAGGGAQPTVTPTATPTTTPTRTATPTSVLSPTPGPSLTPSTTPIGARGSTATPTVFVPGTLGIALDSTVTPGVPRTNAPATATVASVRPAAITPTSVPLTVRPVQDTSPAAPTPGAAMPLAVAQATRLPPAVLPTRAPAVATTVSMAPLVVATAGGPDARPAVPAGVPAGNANPSAFVLIGAAGLLLMGGLYAILRQSQK